MLTAFASVAAHAALPCDALVVAEPPTAAQIDACLQQRKAEERLLKSAKVRAASDDYATYQEKAGWSGAFFESMAVRARVGVTNNDGDIDRASGITEDLDGTNTDFGVEVGWYGRPLVRDFVVRAFDSVRDDYAKWKVAHKRNGDTSSWARSDWANLLLLDAVKVDLTAGYGRVIDDGDGGGNTDVETKGIYTARLRWEVPLDFFAPRNPFDQ